MNIHSLFKKKKLNDCPFFCNHGKSKRNVAAPLLLTVDSVVPEGALRGLAGHIDNGASRSSGLHITSHYLRDIET